jgi:hypothetical protein
MRDINFPPVRKSFSAKGVCQSGDALHHFVMCSGAFQNFHTFSTGAFTVVSTVILLNVVSIILFFRTAKIYNGKKSVFSNFIQRVKHLTQGLIRANQLGHQDSTNFVPAVVDLPENDKDVLFADQLNQIISKSASLHRKLTDSFIEVGLEGLESALLIKAQIKLANRAGVPGAKAADDELSALFKQSKKAVTPP